MPSGADGDPFGQHQSLVEDLFQLGVRQHNGALVLRKSMAADTGNEDAAQDNHTGQDAPKCTFHGISLLKFRMSA